jgi:UDP-N-acetyl-D-mannosaminuronic acid transferase (WecB/TagA/CpsF family)
MPTEITGQNGAVIKKTTQIAVKNCANKPSVKIGKIRRVRNGLLVTATTNAAGTVWVSGAGLKTTHKKLPTGTHQIRVAYTKWGHFLVNHHKKTSVRVKLIEGSQAVAKSAAVRL